LKKYSNSEVWTESLIFLFELVADESPEWKEVLHEAIFGSEWSEIGNADQSASPLAILTARLVVNQHVGWERSARQECTARIACWLAKAQGSTRPGRDSAAAYICQVLLTGASDAVNERFRTIVDSFAGENARLMAVSNTEVSDVSCVAKLQSLEELYLSGTRIRSISALTECKNLRRLYIAGTPISDLSAVKEMPALLELNVYNMKIADVSPIVACPTLKLVYLSDCSPERHKQLREMRPDVRFVTP
jgi:hypothetical protein